MEFGAEHINLSQVQFTDELLRCIPAEMARRYRVLPVFKDEVRVGVAMAITKLGDLNTIDDLLHSLNLEIEIFAADEYQLNSFIERFYGNTKTP
jgi:type IV pilus assembly protein PilB